MSPLPLEGVRILAFTQLGAGPFGMTVLADLGAEVIKVEDPTIGGDEARNVPPGARDGDSVYFQSLNRNAKSLTLNLRVPEGRALFHRLVKVCDAVYSNPRGDLPAKLGLDYASLKHVNPKIVCCALSGFGKTGPMRADPGYDFLLQAMAGFMSLTGDPHEPPTRSGISIVDFAGGLMSTVGLLTGLLRARSTGVGCDVDVSLLDTAVSMLNYLAVWVLNTNLKVERLPDNAHQTLVPSQRFATKDGYLVIMCMKEKFWTRLAERTGLAHLLDDPRFRTFADRLAHRDELIPILNQVMRTKTSAEWVAQLRGHVPCAAVATIEEALQNDQVRAREMVIGYEHPLFGTVRQVGCPIKIDDVQPRYGPASALGADTERLLRAWLGASSEEIAALRTAGAI
ncbi:MAG TPA: CoA transferase [Candidatus Binatia bacterium]|nr:CoA transferase [Candidatus Binatia bacterium]